MTSHQIAKEMLAKPDVKVSVIVTNGKYNRQRTYSPNQCPVVTALDCGEFININGGRETRFYIIAEKANGKS